MVADVNLELSEKLGWTFNMKIFWEDRVRFLVSRRALFSLSTSDYNIGA